MADRPKVFISYSHDSEAHRERVLGLSQRLRQDGIVAEIDRYVEGSPLDGWPRWMLNQIDNADRVLLCCTETYYRRFRGHESPGTGKGGDCEGAIITQEIYDARSYTKRFVPVLFHPDDAEFIPEPVRGQTFHCLESEAAYQKLYDALLDQAGVEPHPIGEPKRRERDTAYPLLFGDNPGHANYLTQRAGGTQATRYYVDPPLPLSLDLAVECTLKRIEPHRLAALIVEDVYCHPDTRIGDIHQRIGPEIPRSRVSRALEQLVKEGKLSREGARRGTRYRLP